MEKIGVFCSASELIDPLYFEKAKELGCWLGKQGKTLVYGGSDRGLMECLAKAVKEHGGRVFGVVPTKLEEKGRVSKLLDVTFHTCNLSDRKDTMVSESDVLVALPGGIGTLDEVFHTMAAYSLGYHSKKVIFYNINGYYDALLSILDGLEATHFAHRPMSHYMKVASTFDELVAFLDE